MPFANKNAASPGLNPDRQGGDLDASTATEPRTRRAEGERSKRSHFHRSCLALSCLLAVGSLHAQDPIPAQDTVIETQLKRFIDVLAAVSAQSADEVATDNAFYNGAIPGMLRALDPHSVFFDPGQFNQLKQMENSERKGFGSVVSVLPGRVIFLQTLPGTPSGNAGLAPGDEMVAINNIALARLTFEELVQVLSESRQHEIQIVVRRPGSVRLLTFQLKPELMD
ncbi:MAG: PDZ domain-containing protein, partial [Bryobacteraceae bacterium]